MFIDKEYTAVTKYTVRLKNKYKIHKRYASKNKWPPFTPAQFTNLGYVIHKPKRSKEEIESFADFNRKGSFSTVPKHGCAYYSFSDNVFDEQTSIKENIVDIFLPASGNLQIILAEGGPGIGKTMLLKEIAYLWSTGNLLVEKKVVLLLSLRNPEINNIIKSSVDLFFWCCKHKESAQLYARYFYNNSGEGLVILLDGLDENPKVMDEDTFLFELISGGYYSKACIVITSRPHTTIEIEKFISYRVEIIGFTMQRRYEFVQKNLNSDDAALLEKYLQEYKVIDTLCHIPLNLSILLSLVKGNKKLGNNNSLPETQTQLIKNAVEMTISHNLCRKGLAIKQTGVENLPDPYREMFYEICAMAYKALIRNKFTFTSGEIEAACPVYCKGGENIKEATFYDLGLIQAAQFFSDYHTEVLCNFVHFAVQEYLSAFYLSIWHKKLFWHIPIVKTHLRKCAYFYIQQREFKNKFWNGDYINMWCLYTGLTGGNDPAFRHFLTGNGLCSVCRTQGKEHCISKAILDNKIYTLLLYLCLQEAPKNELKKHLGELIKDNCLNVSNENLSPQDVDRLSNILSRPYLTMQWELVNLACCGINDDKFISLEAVLTRNDGRDKPKINSLSLCGNKLKLCCKFIARLVQNQKILHLYLSKNAIVGLNELKICVLLETLDISSNNLSENTPKLFKAVKKLKRLKTLKLNNNAIDKEEYLDDVYSLCHCDSLKILELEGNAIEDQALMIFETIDVIRNSTLNKIYFRMTDKAIVFIKILQYCNQADSLCTDRCSLQDKLSEIIAVNLSRNGLYDSDAIMLGKCLHLLGSLESLDISENNVSDESTNELTKGLLLTPFLKQFKYDESLFEAQSIIVFEMILYLRNMPSNVISFKFPPSQVNAFTFVLECINELDEHLVWQSDIVRTVGCVRELDFRYDRNGNKLCDESIGSLCLFLRWFRKLKFLNLANNNITIEATEPLVICMLQMFSFKEIDVIGNPIADSILSMTIFSTIKDLHQEKLQSFTCNEDSDHVLCQSTLYILQKLSKMRNARNSALLSKVSQLAIRSVDCKFSHRLVEWVNFLPSLRCIDVSGATISDYSMKELSIYLSTTHQLEKLDLSSSDLKHLQVQRVLESNSKPCLKYVNFKNCKVTNETLSHLVNLLKFNDLDVLELEENVFDNCGIACLYNALVSECNEICATIGFLNLSKNNLNSSSAEHIIKIVKTCKVRLLNVSQNNLVALLPYFKPWKITTIEYLDISYINQSTNKGVWFVKSLGCLENCSALKTLNISGNYINRNAVQFAYSFFISCVSLETVICVDNPATDEIELAFRLVKNLYSKEGCGDCIDLRGYSAAVGAFVTVVLNKSGALYGTFATNLELHVSQVKQLDLSSASLQIDEDFVCLLKKFVSLQSLDLSGNNITDKTFKHLATGVLFTPQLKIENLHLKDNPCDGTKDNHFILEIIEDIRLAGKHFVCLPEKFNAFLIVLELLYKGNNEQSDLCKVIPLIESIDVSYPIITNTNLEKFSDHVKLSSVNARDFHIYLKYFKSWKTINIGGNLSADEITNYERKSKIAIFNNCDLTETVLCNLTVNILLNNDLEIVDIAGNSLGDDGVKSFCKAIVNCELNTTIGLLNLSRNHLNPVSSSKIAELIGYCKVKVLRISGNFFQESILKLLHKITTLVELDISANNRQTDNGISFAQSISCLSGCKLKKLNLSSNNIDHDAIHAIMCSFINCVDLDEVICDDNPAEREIKFTFNLVKKFYDLQVSFQFLTFKDYPATANAFISVVASYSLLKSGFTSFLEFHANAIREIDFSGNSLQINKGFVTVLKTFSNLQVLNLCDNEVTDETFKYLASGSLFTPKLKKADLHLKGNPCDDSEENHFILEVIEDIRLAGKHFVCLPEKFNAFLIVLELLYKGNNEQSDLCKVIPLIESIDVSYPITTNTNLENFSNHVKLSSVNARDFHIYLKHFKSLKTINIGGDLSADEIFNCGRKSMIAIFNNCGLTETVLHNLTVNILLNNDLEILDIADNSLGDDEVESFCKAILNCDVNEFGTTISLLNLSKNHLTQISSSMIVKIVELCRIKVLNISGNHLQESLFQQFQNLNAFTVLENLNISANNSQADNGIQFAQSINCLSGCKLKKLNLSSNNIDHDAIHAIMCSFINCVDLDEVICDDNPAEREIKFTFNLVKKFYDLQVSFQFLTFKDYPATANAFISVVASYSLLKSGFTSFLKFHANAIREIDFSGNSLQINKSFITFLKTFSSLQVLNLCNSEVTDERFNFVAAGFLFTSKLRLVNLNLNGNPCTSNKQTYLILEMIEEIRVACKDNFMCLPANFKTFLSVLYLVDMVNSEESDVCRIIFSLKSLNISYSEIASSFSSSGGKKEFSRFVKLDSDDAKQFCIYLKHFKLLETLNMGGNNIKEDAKDDLVTSILKNSSILEIQLERNPLCKIRRIFKLFDAIKKLRNSKIPFPFKDQPETLQAYADLLQYIDGFEDKFCDLVVKPQHLNIREFYQSQKQGRFYGIENVDNPKLVIEKFFSHLSLFCNLRTLDLCDASLSARSLRKLSTFVCTSQTLQKLDISLNKITAEGALIILRPLSLISSRALQYIDMTSNDIGGKFSEEVVTIIISLAFKIDVVKGNRLHEKSKRLLRAK